MCYHDMREQTNQSDTVESGILGPSESSGVRAYFVSELYSLLRQLLLHPSTSLDSKYLTH